jgi:glycosyltransferase involved in cell wall biosynthesis
VVTQDLRSSLRSIMEGLNEVGLLKQVVTTIGLNPYGVWKKLSENPACPDQIRKGIQRRILPEFLKDKTEFLFFSEVIRILASKLVGNVTAHRVWRWAELNFDRQVAEKYAGRYQCIYGMEHSSLETFRRQKEKGGFCLLRQVMAHAKSVAAIHRRFKSANSEVPYYELMESEMDQIVARKEAEYELADLIVANSDFVRDSFIEAGIDAKKVIAIPTGCPEPSGRYARSGMGNRSLRFLFAGNLSYRKGIVNLLAAWKELNIGERAQLHLAGPIEMQSLDLNLAGVQYHGALSFGELQKLYLETDVFVLPTMLEGLAHVILEALSVGLPIITTKESGCGALIQNQRNGLLIKSNDTQELQLALGWCLENREKLPHMGQESLLQAKNWSVADSNREHLRVIKDFLNAKGMV